MENSIGTEILQGLFDKNVKFLVVSYRLYYSYNQVHNIVIRILAMYVLTWLQIE